MALGAAGAAGAQTPLAPDPLAPVHSTGNPPIWKPFVGVHGSIDNDGQLDAGGAYLGVFKDLLPSIVGIGVAGELYTGADRDRAGIQGGARFFFEFRPIGFKYGWDYDFRSGQTEKMYSLSLPIRRGGIFGRGTQLRIDWIPDRNHTWNVGLLIPLEPNSGRTRPRQTDVDVPRAPKPAPSPAPDPAVAEALRQVRAAARGITILTTAFWPDDKSNRLASLERSRERMREFNTLISQPAPQRPNGTEMSGEVRIFHEQLARAFGLAAGASGADAADRGRRLSAAARQTVLDEVIYPYNRLFGQYKDPQNLWGFAARARVRFTAELPPFNLDHAGRAAVLDVFGAYVAVIEETRAWWGKYLEQDSRLSWLPLPLALTPEQHDTQAEIDAILSKAQGAPLVGGNTVVYANGQQFQIELKRTIYAAEDYHVLWLHDYDGKDLGGNPDAVGHYITVEGYLRALTARVREFDRTGRLPVYMIFVDLHYWEGNKGRIYTDLLQDPLGKTPSLPKQGVAENRAMQESLARAQQELRDAVAGSPRLQEEARRRGQQWLRDYVAVHVSVMNPADFSFRSNDLVGYMPFAPDSLMRDHRKIAFCDLTEADPAKGEAYFAGVGVGEQYMTPTWEDRAVRLTGPAALPLKEAARQYLTINGFREDQIPPALRPVAKAADYDARVRVLESQGWTATAAQVHNERGFAQKNASIASAVLYTLAPSGSLIMVPDSIWTHELWAGFLVGAALRGCRVYVIAPSAANAPAAGFPMMARTREIFSRFVEIGKILGDTIAARGGSIHAGLYTRRAGVNDVRAKLAEMHETFERYPFLKTDFPFPPEFYEGFSTGIARLDAMGYQPDSKLPEDAVARAPKLHRKTQLLVTKETLDGIVRDRRVQDSIAAQIRFAVTRGVVFDTEGVAKPGASLQDLYGAYLDAFASLPEGTRDRSVAYMTVGSLNKDARGMMTDGEVLQVTAGTWALAAVPALWMLSGSTTWLESQEELDRLLPPYKGWQRLMARWIRKVI
ncbi:MAG TPA: hypothetical protein VLN08_13115 [Vicinamibacterales bacterium]|nr:hypothetical protein [Vicinamibacterales bacterium]